MDRRGVMDEKPPLGQEGLSAKKLNFADRLLYRRVGGVESSNGGWK
jgi:hypothetical protein